MYIVHRKKMQKKTQKKKDAKEKRDVNDFFTKVGLMREARIMRPACQMPV